MAKFQPMKHIKNAFRNVSVKCGCLTIAYCGKKSARYT